MARVKATAVKCVGGKKILVKPDPVKRARTIRRQRNGKYKSGDRALKEIRYYQKTTDLVIKKLPFQRVVRDILADEKVNGGLTKLRFKHGAVNALQEAVESLATDFLRNADMISQHAKRKTFRPSDIRLACTMMGIDLPKEEVRL